MPVAICEFLSFNQFECFRYYKNKILKTRRASGGNFEFCGNRIVELSNETLATIGIEDKSNLDMKYELFCQWLQQNEQNHQQMSAMDEKSENEDRDQHSMAILTEDEVSGFDTNSDASGSDIFLDTESDFPLIVLSSDDNTTTHVSLYNDQKSIGVESATLSEFRVDTPSQLSVSDFDCSSSDITVNSRVSATSDSSNQMKRKAKHKKGRAPPIPTLLAKSNSPTDDNSNKVFDTESTDGGSASQTPSITRTVRETDIWRRPTHSHTYMHWNRKGIVFFILTLCVRVLLA